MIIPLLNIDQCQIREQLNCCEVFKQCESKRCRINPQKHSKTTLFDLLDIIDEVAADPGRVARGEIGGLTDAARLIIATAVATLGIGLSIDWPADRAESNKSND